LVGIAVVLVALSVALTLALRRQSGVVVLPFDVASGLNLSGTALADVLVARLQYVSEMHAQEPPPAIQTVNVSTEQLTLPVIVPSQEDLTAAFADLGKISAGVVELSLGNFLVALKLLRRDPRAVIIRGGAQGDPAKVELVVRLETRGAARAFVAGPGDAVIHVAELVDDLVYQVLADGRLFPKPSAPSWRGLKYFTEALDGYIQFTRTGAVEDLRAALQSCELAMRAAKGYRKVFAVAYNVGIAYLNEGDTDNALLAFSTAHESNPKDAGALVGLGSVHHRLGDYGLAIDLHQQALTLATDTQGGVAALAGLGNAWSDRGDLERGVEYFRKAADLASSAGDPLSQAQNLSRLARRYADQGDAAEGVRQGLAAVDLLPPATDPYTRGQLLENLAAVLGDDGRYEEAQRVAKQALVAATEVPSMFLRAKVSLTFARVLLFVGDFEQASVTAEAASIQHSGFRHTAVAFRGVAALRLGKLTDAEGLFAEAIKEADRMIDKDPRNFGAYYAKALAMDGLASTGRGLGRNPDRATELAADAASVRRRATEINPNPGVVARQQRLVATLG
jgi:tetratricopeptide (TPR) repeat protein